eukprot:419430-Amphidinium_carterae.1
MSVWTAENVRRVRRRLVPVQPEPDELVDADSPSELKGARTPREPSAHYPACSKHIGGHRQTSPKRRRPKFGIS